MKKLLLATLASLSLVSAPASAADLTFQYYAFGDAYNLFGSPNTFASGGGGFFGEDDIADNGNISYFSYTADENQIIFSYIDPTSWSSSVTSLNENGLFIASGALITNPNINISSVAIDASSTDLGGFSLSNITFNNNNVAAEWAGLSFTENSRIVLNLNGFAGAVPEPATWAFIIFGFGAIGGAMRSRRKTNVKVSYA